MNKVCCFKTVGGSMRPTIKPDSFVMLSVNETSLFRDSQNDKTAHPINLGDIIAYRLGGKNFCHRIVGIADNGFWVSDDAGIINKHLVKKDDVLGKVIGLPFWCEGIFGFFYSKVVRYLFKIFRPLKQYFHI